MRIQEGNNEGNKLLIKIEDEYKSKKKIADLLWKSQELITNFLWLNIEKTKKMFIEYFKDIKDITSINGNVLDNLQNNKQNVLESFEKFVW